MYDGSKLLAWMGHNQLLPAPHTTQLTEGCHYKTHEEYYLRFVHVHKREVTRKKSKRGTRLDIKAYLWVLCTMSKENWRVNSGAAPLHCFTTL